MLLLPLLVMSSACSAADSEGKGQAQGSLFADFPVPGYASQVGVITDTANPNIRQGVKYELQSADGAQAGDPPKDYWEQLQAAGWSELKEDRIGHVQFFRKEGTTVAVELHEGTMEVYEMKEGADY